MADLGSSIIRTVVPLIVGAVIGLAAEANLDLPNESVSAIVTVLVTAGYYAVARWVELNASPKIGRILLSLGLTRKTPEYTTKS